MALIEHTNCEAGRGAQAEHRIPEEGKQTESRETRQQYLKDREQERRAAQTENPEDL